jgi:hypothetical protein
MQADEQEDVAAIRAVIGRQFASLCWGAGQEPGWQAFRADFLPGAALYPAARPARPQSVDAFVERMKGLAGSTLASFHEAVLGTRVQVFGNVAVALAACENTENGSTARRAVEMMLLVREGGRWRIAAQAWDKETESNPIPPELLAGD